VQALGNVNQSRGDQGAATALVVEDNAQVRRFEVLALRDAGLHVLEATSGHEALQFFRDPTIRVGVLLADVMLPDMSGIDLACAARQAQPHIRILFISGYSAEILGQAALARVPHGFLEKPFSVQTLTRSVSNLIETEPPASKCRAAAPAQ
jgi:two-component system cell cycle sensor histidine kinase/response regulator CckA